MVAFAPERDLVARFEAELVAEVLGDDDLPLGPYLVSHTSQYNIFSEWTKVDGEVEYGAARPMLLWKSSGLRDGLFGGDGGSEVGEDGAVDLA